MLCLVRASENHIYVTDTLPTCENPSQQVLWGRPFTYFDDQHYKHTQILNTNNSAIAFTDAVVFCLC